MTASSKVDIGAEAQDLFAAASWYEVKALCTPESFYAWLAAEYPEEVVLMWHHFYEPWHRKGPVVRLLLAADYAADITKRLDEWEWTVGVEPWEREEDDVDHFGEEWFQFAMMFFQASSMFVGHPKADYMTVKLIHCFLNARGMTRKQEIRWALKYAWRSATLEPKLRWRAWRTGRKWWER